VRVGQNIHHRSPSSCACGIWGPPQTWYLKPRTQQHTPVSKQKPPTPATLAPIHVLLINLQPRRRGRAFQPPGRYLHHNTTQHAASHDTEKTLSLNRPLPMTRRQTKPRHATTRDTETTKAGRPPSHRGKPLERAPRVQGTRPYFDGTLERLCYA
jgi:hypothetical protein